MRPRSAHVSFDDESIEYTGSCQGSSERRAAEPAERSRQHGGAPPTCCSVLRQAGGNQYHAAHAAAYDAPTPRPTEVADVQVEEDEEHQQRAVGSASAATTDSPSGSFTGSFTGALAAPLRDQMHSWDLSLFDEEWADPSSPQARAAPLHAPPRSRTPRPALHALPPLAWLPRQLPLLVKAIFDELGLSAYFMLRPATLCSFVREVSAGYRRVPFHNFHHGVAVLQGCYAMLRQSAELCSLLTITDRLALCVAALGHDLGHTGTSNAFLINSQDPLALQYNDVAVLESHHAASLFRVLLRPECAILATLDARDFKDVRKSVIGAVLATDMAKHFHDIGRLKTRLEARQAGAPLSVDDPLDRQMILEMTLHASDLSGPVRPWEARHGWLKAPSTLL